MNRKSTVPGPMVYFLPMVSLLLTACLLLAGYSALTSREPTETQGSFAEESSKTGQDAKGPEDQVLDTTAADSQEYPGQNTATVEETGLWEEESQEPDGKEPVYEPYIIVASDIHYLAKELQGEAWEGGSFEEMAYRVDGRAVYYVREITDAFIEEVIQEKPELLILSGDLTMDGTKKSHQELARRLEAVRDAGILVAVIPGNHDINNPDAAGYDGDMVYEEERITADEFREIYRELGYGDALSCDVGSLSYLYRLDDNYWIMMLDACQYDPINLVGGMIQDGTYSWLEEQLDVAWEEGVQIISVTHQNLLDQSGVSKEFYDNCTIEHDEKLINYLNDFGVTLHLSGHLHMQHFMRSDEDQGLYEIVSSSLSMAPFQYGILKIQDTGEIDYHTDQVDVASWAKKHGKSDPNLLDFSTYGTDFLSDVTYQHAYEDLKRHVGYENEGELSMTTAKAEQMAEFYSKVCRYYYAGRMYEILGKIREDPAFQMWVDYGHVTELSDFLNNILEEEAEDFNRLLVPF